MNAGPDRILHVHRLIDAGACDEQIRTFRERFGNWVRVTPERCAAYATVFHWAWAARNLLSAPALAEYERVRAPAWAEYERVTAAARAKHQRVTARAEYQRVTAPAGAEYQRVTAAARAEYARVKAAARAEYARVRAAAFGRAYNLHAWGAGALV